MNGEDAITLATVAISRMDAHEKVCGERYHEISNNLGDIKSILGEMRRTADESTKRLHDRIDATASEARSNSGLALTAAKAASDEIKAVQIKTYSAMGVAGIGVIGWLVDRMTGR